MCAAPASFARDDRIEAGDVDVLAERRRSTMELTTYLYFDGDCEQAFKFYEKALGGHIAMMFKYDEAPSDQPCAENLRNRIMHARLVIGDQKLMGSDVPVGAGEKPQGFGVALNVATPEDAERVFADLSQGGRVNHPLAETFFSHKFGMLQDRFGVDWLVNCEKKPG
jgi:PhnB protein